MNDMIKGAVIGATAGLAVGATAGVLYARKQFTASLSELQDEVAEHYKKLEKDFDEAAVALMEQFRQNAEQLEKTYSNEGTVTPVSEVEKHEDNVTQYNKIHAEKTGDQKFDSVKEAFEALHPEGITEKVTHNIFEFDKSGTPIPEEMDRTGKQIFIISLDEYDEENDYVKTPVTFYAGDNTACDVEDRIVNIEECLGVENLTMFGKGAEEDPDELHIRNTALGVDYHVYRDEASYAENILGIDPDDNPEFEPNRRVNRGSDD